MVKSSILLAVLGVTGITSGTFAASATWTGAVDGLFTNNGNWTPAAAPNTGGDLATFNNNVNTTISTPATLPGINFTVDTAGAGSFTFGTSATTVTPGSGWFLNVTSLVTTAQTFNPLLSLGARATPANITITNASTTVGQTLTVNSDVTSLSTDPAGIWTVRLNGAGTKIFNGKFSNGATGLIVRTTGGITQLNGVNTYSGGTLMDSAATSVQLGNKSALGTGAVSVAINGNTFSALADLSGGNAVAVPVNFINNNYYTTNIAGAQNLEFSGAMNLNSNAGTTAFTFNGGQTFNVTNTGLTTFSGVVSGNGTNQAGLVKTGAGVLVLSGANTYGGAAQGTTVGGGTLLLNNTSGSATGASGQVSVNTGGTIGGNGSLSGLLVINTGGAFRPGALGTTSTAVLTSTSTGNSALVLNVGSTTLFDVLGTAKGTGYDNFTTAGRVNYGGDFTINIANVPANATTVYDLFSSATVNASFNSITLTGSYSGTLTNNAGVWSGTFGSDTVSFAQSSGDLTVTSVPEPAAGLVLVVGGLFAARRRRA